MSTEVEDYNSRASKRRRVDVGVPRGTHAHHQNKIGAVVTNGGIAYETDNSDVLRTLLKNSKKSQNGTVTPPLENPNESPLMMSQLLKAKAKEFEEFDAAMEKNAETSEHDETELSSDELETMDGSANDASAIPDCYSANRVKCNGNSTMSPGSMSPGNMSSDNMCPGEVSPNPLSEDSVKAKRARVENIITSMRQSPSCPQSSQGANPVPEPPRAKRKQAQPQQQKSSEAESNQTKQLRRQERRRLKYLLGHLQQQLDVLQEKYFDLYEEDNSSLSDASDDLDDLNEPIDTMSAIRKCENTEAQKTGQIVHRKGMNGSIPKESHQKLRNSLKQQLTNALSTTVDSVIDRFADVEDRRGINNNNNNKLRTALPKNLSPEMSTSVLQQAARNATLIVPVPAKRPTNTSSQGHQHNRVQSQQQQQEQLEQTEAISLVIPKRNRSKDSESVLRIGQPDDVKQDHVIPTMLPTSVAIPNPSLYPSFPSMMMTPPAYPSLQDKDSLLDDMRYGQSPLLTHSQQTSISNHGGGDLGDVPHTINDGLSYSFIKSEDSDSMMRGSPGLSDLSGYSPANGTSLTSTLTPTHLRKAKLMFFYTRYPSSALLRQHFLDVKFNRHNTSQIIKWFSNFREFYYIQMEKFARQAMSDGVDKKEDLLVIRDMELFRTLNMHYNKSNEFQVPESFMSVSTSTLREFFEAIKLGKDSEPSWKKTIYKVIGKMDEPLPDLFKSSNCLEELE
ncbi:prospero homeobox protein 1-like isoform X2 [Asterias amurensis]|uniref:prospero homeobox protein 1-like isoform X2 n=1 Tax=Asterias amurensis TaxID=7602 RepID=UPI003AB4A82F